MTAKQLMKIVAEEREGMIATIGKDGVPRL